MPLAVCLLALLTLADRFFPSLLWPSVDPKLESLIGIRAFYEGVLDGPPVLSEQGLKFTVSGLTREGGERLGGEILLTLAGPEADSFERGDRIRFHARLKKPARYKNPGGFDYRRYLRRRGILLTGFIDKAEDAALLKKGGGFLSHVDGLRGRIRSLVQDEVSGEGGGLIAALVMGDVSGLGEETFSDFRATGTSHLIAVSGQHIAIVGLVVFAVLFWLLKRSESILIHYSARRLALGLSLVPVVFYVLLAGAPPSAVRAVLLAFFIALAAASEREPDGASSLAAAAILIGMTDPSAPFSASFQLSFLAVLGILLFRCRGGREAAPLAGSRTRIRKYFINPFWLTVGATLMTAPVVAYRFHEVSLSGVLVNLAAIPVAGVLLIFGFVSVLAAVALPAAGIPLLRAAGFSADCFLHGLHAAASWSRHWNLVESFYPTEIEVVLAFAAVGLAVWIRRHPEELCFWRRPRFTVAASCFLLLVFVTSFDWPRSDLEIVFLDVGQGDATLVLMPSGKSLLVDGGGFLIPGGRERSGGFDVGRDVVVPYLKRRGLDRIDAVLLSHPHPDHFGGLKAVFEAFSVGEFWWNGQTFPDASFDRLLETIQAAAVPMKMLRSGEDFAWGGGRVEVFYPDRVSRGRSINDNSLVVRLSFGEADVLFAGDIEKEGEMALADRFPIESTLLKIPHHASRTSSSVPFIDSVRPAVAVASLGEDNLFGFPHAGVLEKYERRGVRVHRTDRDGAVTVRLSPGLPRKSPAIRTFFSGE